MGNSHTAAKSKTLLLSGVLEKISAAQLETLEILSDVDQMTQLMSSLLEARSGQIVSLDKAFADL